MRVRVWQCFCRSASVDIRRVISSLLNDFRIDCSNKRDTWHQHLTTSAFLSYSGVTSYFFILLTELLTNKPHSKTGKMNGTGSFVIFGPRANCTLDVRFLKLTHSYPGGSFLWIFPKVQAAL